MARGLATNLCLQSGPMTVAPWTSANLNFTGSQTDPTGGTNATLMVEQADGGNSNHYVGITGAAYPAVGVPVLVSFYAKPGARNFSGFRAGGGSLSLTWNLTTYAVNVITGSVIASGAEAVSSGFVRCWVLYYSYGPTDALRFYVCNVNSSLAYTGTLNTQAMTIFGAMVEATLYGQTTPSPYIATAASAVSGPREWRQNWLRQSDTVNQTSAWVQTRLSSVATDGTLQPNGVAMYKVTEDSTAASTHILSQTTATNIPTSAYRTFYAILKAGSRTYAAIAADGANQGAMFDLTNGTSTANSLLAGGSASIVSLGSGCYLCSITCTASTTSSAQVIIYLSSGPAIANVTYSGNGTGYIYVGQTGVAQGNQVPTHITTTTAVANASGAPRSLVV